MSIAIRFVGGPADGRTLAVPDSAPPFRYLVPLPLSVSDLAAAALDPVPIVATEYEPICEHGQLRRADDGAYLYLYRPAPVSPEQRRALEEARHEMRAREEQRARELDEAWADIRRQRPHFPADWRDI
jgi:hypothetical protein